MAAKTKVTIKIDGIDVLKRAIKDAPEILREELSKAIMRTAFNVMRAGQARAPRGEGGDLANAVTYAVRNNALVGRVGIDSRRVASRGGASSHQHPSVYGTFIYKGWKYHPAGNDFLIQAAEANRQAYIANIQAAGLQVERRMSRGA